MRCNLELWNVVDTNSNDWFEYAERCPIEDYRERNFSDFEQFHKHIFYHFVHYIDRKNLYVQKVWNFVLNNILSQFARENEGEKTSLNPLDFIFKFISVNTKSTSKNLFVNIFDSELFAIDSGLNITEKTLLKI